MSTSLVAQPTEGDQLVSPHWSNFTKCHSVMGGICLSGFQHWNWQCVWLIWPTCLFRQQPVFRLWLRVRGTQLDLNGARRLNRDKLWFNKALVTVDIFPKQLQVSQRKCNISNKRFSTIYNPTIHVFHLVSVRRLKKRQKIHFGRFIQI